MKKLSLTELTDNMETQNDLTNFLYHKKSGELVYFSDEELSIAESEDDRDIPGWQIPVVKIAEDTLKHPEDYIEIPTQFDIHEYQIMEQFCLSLPLEKAEILADAIRGRGAFRRFKDKIHDLGVADAWFAFKRDYFYEIARDWCEEHNIDYIDDRKV
ncbi:MAG: UPF0158 family protein [Fidelibacterota bacterium]